MSKVLKLSTSWCKPCAAMDVQLEKLNGQFVTEVQHINVEVSPEFAKQYNVRSVPTLIKLDAAGNEVSRSMGSLTDAKLLEFLS
jgi:thioredoxin-like negative regulator of GroEL